MVKLEEVVDFKSGKAHEQFIKNVGKYKVINSKFVSSDGENFKYSDKAITPLIKDDVVMVMSDVPNGKTIAKCFFVDSDDTYTLNQRVGLFRAKNTNVLLQKFLFYQLNRNKQLLDYDNGQRQTNLRKEQILSIDFIIPTLEIQTLLVAEADKEQEIIKASKEVVEMMENKISEVFNEM